jgi:hypothetical protein
MLTCASYSLHFLLQQSYFRSLKDFCLLLRERKVINYGVIKFATCRYLTPCLSRHCVISLLKIFVPSKTGSAPLYLLSGMTKNRHITISSPRAGVSNDKATFLSVRTNTSDRFLNFFKDISRIKVFHRHIAFNILILLSFLTFHLNVFCSLLNFINTRHHGFPCVVQRTIPFSHLLNTQVHVDHINRGPASQ